MGRIYIDVEESPNCAYHPMQTFETRTSEREVNELWISGVPGKKGGHLIVGWSSDNDGDFGLRIKPEDSGVWSLSAADQWGEPFMLLDPNAAIRDIEID